MGDGARARIQNAAKTRKRLLRYYTKHVRVSYLLPRLGSVIERDKPGVGVEGETCAGSMVPAKENILLLFPGGTLHFLTESTPRRSKQYLLELSTTRSNQYLLELSATRSNQYQRLASLSCVLLP